MNKFYYELTIHEVAPIDFTELLYAKTFIINDSDDLDLIVRQTVVGHFLDVNNELLMQNKKPIVIKEMNNVVQGTETYLTYEIHCEHTAPEYPLSVMVYCFGDVNTILKNISELI